MRYLSSLVTPLAALLLFGCGGPAVDSTDAGPSTSDDVDAGTELDRDAGTAPDPDAGTDIDPDAGTEADAGTEPEPEPDAGEPPFVGPTVLSTDPAHGEKGVELQPSLTVTFSRSMDVSSVEAAFSTETLPAVTFSWNANNSILTIELDESLASAAGEGPDPSVFDATAYDFTIGAEATDADGAPLEAEVSVSFTTFKSMLWTLSPVPAFTFTQLANGTKHSIGNPVLYAGESTVVADTAMKAFVGFDLSALPGDVDVIEALLHVKQSKVNGAPYSNLGDLHWDFIAVDATDDDAFDVAEQLSGLLSPNASLLTKTAATTPAVAFAHAYREVFNDTVQFRLRFTEPFDPNVDGGNVELERAQIDLDLEYQAE